MADFAAVQLKQHLLELRQTQESLREQAQLCSAQEEEIAATHAEYANNSFQTMSYCVNTLYFCKTLHVDSCACNWTIESVLIGFCVY